MTLVVEVFVSARGDDVGTLVVVGLGVVIGILTGVVGCVTRIGFLGEDVVR